MFPVTTSIRVVGAIAVCGIVAVAACNRTEQIRVNALDAGTDADSDADSDGDTDTGTDTGPNTIKHYAVATTVDSDDEYYSAVETLAAHREASAILEFDPADLDALAEDLIDAEAGYVAVVLRPSELDVNFARQFLMMSTGLDDDPFCDFSYGFVTGATGTAALELVQQIVLAETEDEVQLLPLTRGSVVVSTVNELYTACDDYSYWDLLETPDDGCADIYLALENPDALSFFEDNQAALAGKKIVELGYVGDPHMLWLFDSATVTDAWEYDPALVESPPVERLGVTADHVRELDLYPAVVVSGAPHGGALGQALVDWTIAPTFGDTSGSYRLYEMSDEFSFALAVLETGATGYFAAVAYNNFDASAEIYDMLSSGAPLGDVYKRDIDRLVMGFEGNRPRVIEYADEEAYPVYETLASGSYTPSHFPPDSSRALSSGANRVLFGDPLFAPFVNDADAAIELVDVQLTEVAEDEIEVGLSFDKDDRFYPVLEHYHLPYSDTFDGTRIHAAVVLPVGFVSPAQDVVVQLTSYSSVYEHFFYALEHHFGEAILHLQFELLEDYLGAVEFEMEGTITRI